MNADDFSCDIRFQRCYSRENQFPFAICTETNKNAFFSMLGKMKVNEVIVWGICQWSYDKQMTKYTFFFFLIRIQ